MIQWNALLGAPNAGQSFMSAYERSRMENALRSASEGDPGAMRYVMGRNPQMGLALEDAQFQRTERKRQHRFREAQSEYMRGAFGRAEPTNALTAAAAQAPGAPPGPTPNALLPQPNQAPASGAAPAAPPTAQPQSADAIARMFEADPVGTQAFLRDQAERATQVLDRATQMAVTVTDQASLDQFRNQVAMLARRAGVQMDMSQIPATYSPEAMERFRMTSMEVGQQLEAIRQGRETDWRIRDGMADNAREDRNTDSLINHRIADIEVRREGHGVTMRGQDISSDTTRRGQDISSETSRRGQDISSDTTRRGQDISAETTRQSGAYGQGQRRQFTGPRFRQPDGRVIQFDTVSGTYVTIGTAGQ